MAPCGGTAVALRPALDRGFLHFELVFGHRHILHPMRPSASGCLEPGRLGAGSQIITPEHPAGHPARTTVTVHGASATTCAETLPR